MMKIAYFFHDQQHAALRHYAQQLGVRYAVTTPQNFCYNGSQYLPPWHYMTLHALQQDMQDFGMDFQVLEGVDFLDSAKLGLPDRDEAIQHFCTLLQNMSRLKIRTVCYNWMPVFGWMRSRKNIAGPGGCLVTGFSYQDVKDCPDTEFGKISADQLWTNLEYFLKRTVPVAEKYGIQMAIPPDDPPVDSIAGIDRILTSADAMEQVTRLVDSPVNGITMCQGSFAAMGEDIPQTIRRFGKAHKIFFAHFRDICGTADNFVETFHHQGQTDMYQAMKAYYEVGYDGLIRPDHVPTMYGDDESNPSYAVTGNLFATGYMLGLMEAAEKEMNAR